MPKALIRKVETYPDFDFKEVPDESSEGIVPLSRGQEAVRDVSPETLRRWKDAETRYRRAQKDMGVVFDGEENSPNNEGGKPRRTSPATPSGEGTDKGDRPSR